MIVLLLIVLGLVAGSFVNAAVWRLRVQEDMRIKKGREYSPVVRKSNLSIVNGRSMCNHCGHQLSAWDLVPVVSYLSLGGKCRYCGKPIDDTPLAELILPVVFVASYIWWPYGWDTALGAVVFAVWLLCLVGFIVLALYDLRWQLLPDRVVFPLIGAAVAEVIIADIVYSQGWLGVEQALWGAAVVAGLFYVLHLVSRGAWIGFGDVKLAIALGLLAGGPLNAVLLIFLASLLGSLAAVPLIAQGKAAGKTRIPFGPFLLAATVIVVLAGAYITSWYAGLFAV